MKSPLWRIPSIMLLAALAMLALSSGLWLLPVHAASSRPWSAFRANPISGGIPLEVQFTDLSVGEIDQWEWDFDGDNATDSTERNPVFTYTTIGKFNVTLKVRGPGGFDFVTRSTWIITHTQDSSPGSLKWSIDLGWIASSSPAVDSEGVVYVGAEERWPTLTGSLYAINPDGSVKWRYMDDGLTGWASPAIDGNMIYYMGEGQLYAFEKDGSLKWNTTLDPNFTVHSERLVMPAIGPDGTIYVAVRQGLYAVNPDGSIKWGRSSNGFSNPVVDSTGNLYVLERGEIISEGYYLAAVDQDGQLVWRSQTRLLSSNLSQTPLALDSNHIYVAGKEGLFAFSYGGSLIWTAAKYELVDDKTSGYGWVPLKGVPSFAVGDGVIYTKGGGGLDFSTSGFLFIDPKTGRVTKTIRNSAIASGPRTPVIGSDGIIYDMQFGVYHDDTLYLRAFNPDGSERMLAANFGNAGVLDISHPVIKDNTLFIANAGKILAINVESPSVASTDWPCVMRDIQHTGRFEISQAPTADFSASVTEGPGPLTVKFTGAYTNAITDFLWDFGDGETSTEPNPTHIYKEDGTFTVSVHVTGPMGEDTAVKTDYIKVLPGIRVLSPSSAYGDGYWYGGDIKEIKWESAGVVGPVKIELRVNPGKGKKKIWTTLFSSVENSGQVTLSVHGIGIIGDFCRIKITSINDPTVSGTSSLFRILPGTKVQSPNGGEQWTIGSTQTIRWASNVKVASVKIELSRDGGLTWTKIISSAPNTGSATWKVKGPATDHARIRILSSSNKPMDRSDKEFSIQ